MVYSFYERKQHSDGITGTANFIQLFQPLVDVAVMFDQAMGTQTLVDYHPDFLYNLLTTY